MAYAKQGQEGKTRLERLQDTARDFAHFLYNRDNEEGKITVLGRDGASWAKLSVFFLIFYGCLAGFFAAMLNIFLTTVPEKEMGPKVRRFLDNRPGLIPTPLIVKSGEVDKNVKKVESFLKPYIGMMNNPAYQNCTNETRREKGSKPCAFDLTTLGECYSPEKNFGYDEGTPCIFFKMNKDNLDIFPRDKPGFLTYFYPFYSEEDWYAPIAALKVNTTDAGVVLCQVHGKNIEVTETFRLNRGAIGKARIEIQP
ncbi:Sodium/potassium-transporting ATPase subunit beta-3 [Acropora cervicornis]|uniref:Sodium/potassium-transporting ATPase subunit beta-3 n=1 Tax=Acropora cervicornis TaxID=6130 RepID=A0AAD9VGQ5_ACRCE|nr:Sodium/potassium-transporting ATPase subunit beta-3 [Acropora cervicornis]